MDAALLSPDTEVLLLVSSVAAAVAGILRKTPFPNEWLPLPVFVLSCATYVGLAGWSVQNLVLGVIGAAAANGAVSTTNNTIRAAKGQEVVVQSKDDHV